jgi:hypothetical protein
MLFGFYVILKFISKVEIFTGNSFKEFLYYIACYLQYSFRNGHYHVN